MNCASPDRQVRFDEIVGNDGNDLSKATELTFLSSISPPPLLKKMEMHTIFENKRSLRSDIPKIENDNATKPILALPPKMRKKVRSSLHDLEKSPAKSVTSDRVDNDDPAIMVSKRILELSRQRRKNLREILLNVAEYQGKVTSSSSTMLHHSNKSLLTAVNEDENTDNLEYDINS